VHAYRFVDDGRAVLRGKLPRRVARAGDRRARTKAAAVKGREGGREGGGG